MEHLTSEIVASRAIAYDEHYLTAGWRPRRWTNETAGAFLSYILDSVQEGHINGNEIQRALQIVGAPALAGKYVLDYCCGTGISAIYFALCGAMVMAFDRSPAAVRIASESARQSGVEDKVRFSVADARMLPYRSNAFDAVFCQSALHIVADYPECAGELARVLRPGAKAVFCEEALGYNLVLGIFRFIGRRTWRKCGGRPLTYPEIRKFGTKFSRTIIHHFNLLGQTKNLLGDRALRNGPLAVQLRSGLRAVERVDGLLLAHVPALRVLCGKVVVEYIR